MLQVNDIVSPLDEPGRFRVLSVSNEEVEVEDEHGFRHVYARNELVLVRHDLSSLLNEKVPSNRHESTDKIKLSKKHIKNQRKDWLEYDLHAGVLIGNTAGMSNHEILTEQLVFAREMIEKAKRGAHRHIVFVHGKGKGKLRSGLHLMLKGMTKIQYYDAEYSKYSGGATAVELL